MITNGKHVHSEAIQKLRKMVSHIPVCMFSTFPGTFPPAVRPMSVLQVDDNGRLWFMSNRTSRMNEQIRENDCVQLLFSEPGEQWYWSVTGHAEEIYDSSKIEDLWNPLIKAWFTQGKEDPDLTLISVKPVFADFWGSKNGKFASYFRMFAAALTGDISNDSTRGRLQL
jgi:general stress protein 26